MDGSDTLYKFQVELSEISLSGIRKLLMNIANN